METKNKFKIQDDQYKFPYHHLVSFDPFNNYAVMPWGFEYYAYLKKVFELIDQKPFHSLLDVGCGEGKMILELKKKYPDTKMVGIDLSERAILFAKAFNFENDAQFDCKDLSQLDGSFDLITLVETMEHIPDAEIQGVVREVYKHLNPEGRVIVTVPSVNFPLLSKHYRHYDIGTILKQFDNFSLESEFYMVKQGFLYKCLIRFSRKFCSFSMLRRFSFFLSKTFIQNATKDTGRHVVCVLKKK